MWCCGMRGKKYEGGRRKDDEVSIHARLAGLPLHWGRPTLGVLMKPSGMNLPGTWHRPPPRAHLGGWPAAAKGGEGANVFFFSRNVWLLSKSVATKREGPIIRQNNSSSLDLLAFTILSSSLLCHRVDDDTLHWFRWWSLFVTKLRSTTKIWWRTDIHNKWQVKNN